MCCKCSLQLQMCFCGLSQGDSANSKEWSITQNEHLTRKINLSLQHGCIQAVSLSEEWKNIFMLCCIFPIMAYSETRWSSAFIASSKLSKFTTRMEWSVFPSLEMKPGINCAILIRHSLTVRESLTLRGRLMQQISGFLLTVINWQNTVFVFYDIDLYLHALEAMVSCQYASYWGERRKGERTPFYILPEKWHSLDNI